MNPKISNFYISINFFEKPNFYNITYGFPENHIITKRNVNLTSEIVPLFPGRIFYESDYFNLFHQTPSWIDFNSIWRLTATYIEINDTYVNGYGAFICSKIWCRYPFANHFKVTDGVIENVVDEAIYFSNSFMHMYAHMIVDFFAPFLQLDEELRNNVPLIISAQCERALEMYEILGYDRNKAVVLSNRDNWIHVNHLYTILGDSQVNAFFGVAFVNLRQVLHEKLNLDKKKPSMYLLYNREKGVPRHFINIRLLYIRAQKMSNELKDNLIMTSEIPRETSKAAAFWNNVKFVFMPTGSNVANCIFMQNCSVICIHMMDWNDTPAISACFSSNITVFISLTSRCHHYSPDNCRANIMTAAQSIKKAVQYLETNFN